MTAWTWQLVLVSDPRGAYEAANGFSELARHAEGLAEIGQDLSKVPWTGQAADAFDEYLGKLGKSIIGAHEVSRTITNNSVTAAESLTALIPAATDAANRLNDYTTRYEAYQKALSWTSGIYGAIALLRMRAAAQAALKRVREQRDEVLDAYAKAVHRSIDALLDHAAPEPPGGLTILDPRERALVAGLAKEVSETRDKAGASERAREFIDKLNRADDEAERRELLQEAVNDFSAAELDYLMDNTDVDALKDATSARDWPISYSDKEQRELFNGLAKKLDRDSLEALASELPGDPWHPDPYGDVPKLGEKGGVEGWNLSWDNLPGTHKDVEPGDINPDHIEQNGIGDCYLQSSLQSIASTPEGRQLLADGITRNDNGTFTVMLYDDDGKQMPVVVTPDTPVAQDANGWHSEYNRNREPWHQLYQKAFAQANVELRGGDPGYEGIVGGFSEPTMERITGKSAEDISARSLDQPFVDNRDWLKEAGAEGRPLTYETEGNEDLDGDGKNELVGPHAYSIKSVDWSTDPPMVELRNPWGPTQITKLPMDQLADAGGRIIAGRTR